MTLLSTRIEGLPLVHRGKVRETYAVGDDRLLLVATDRLSAFDVVFDQPIPDKGRVLTQLSAWWFERLADLGPSHFISADARDLPAGAEAPELAGRSMLVRRAERIDAECVVRGYLAGSGWAEYQRSGSVVRHELPAGLREADPLPEPIFTPSTKAEVGHDENITREQLAEMVGADVARQLEERSLALYRAGAELASAVGLILADTKFEFGWIDGQIALIDEVFTPDSGRFWDAARYEPGSSPASFDKQYVRDFVAASGWNKEPPAPTLPDDVIAGTRDRYVTAYSRLTGRAWQPPEDVGLVRWLADVHVRLRPGIADPEGQTITGGLHALGYDSVEEVRAGKLLRIAFTAGRSRRRRGGRVRHVQAPARQPGDGDRRLGAARRGGAGTRGEIA